LEIWVTTEHAANFGDHRPSDRRYIRQLKELERKKHQQQNTMAGRPLQAGTTFM